MEATWVIVRPIGRIAILGSDIGLGILRKTGNSPSTYCTNPAASGLETARLPRVVAAVEQSIFIFLVIGRTPILPRPCRQGDDSSLFAPWHQNGFQQCLPVRRNKSKPGLPVTRVYLLMAMGCSPQSAGPLRERVFASRCLLVRQSGGGASTSEARL